MASRDERVALIRALEEARGGTHVISYVTSTRNGLEVQIAMDVVPLIYEHLVRIGSPKDETRIDLLIHSNGGDGIVPWRLVNLIREYSSHFAVLVPHRAYSAATVMALGADEVVMHPMGTLGPTDPTVANPFNPKDSNGQAIGISVEDVVSYLALVKEEVGIRHEDELVQAFVALTNQIHPLALGNVKRSTAQSQMMGEKLLRLRSELPLNQHEMTEVIHKLTSQLYYHGHPINRREAREDLGLSFVQNSSEAEEAAMWGLYQAYADEMDMESPFRPLEMAYAQNPIAPPPPSAPPNPPTPPATSHVTLPAVTSVCIESVERSDVHTQQFEVALTRDFTGAINANIFRSAAGWTTYP